MPWQAYLAVGLSALTFLYVIWRDNRKARISGEVPASQKDIETVRESLRSAFAQADDRLRSAEEKIHGLAGRFEMFVEMQHERAKLRVDDVHHPDPEHSTADRLLDKFREDKLRDNREVQRLLQVMAQRKNDESLPREERDAAMMIYWALRLKYPI